jgi:hypothetical protein
MSFLHVKDKHTYNSTHKKMKKYLEELGRTIDIRKMFSHQNVGKNVYLLQKIYEKKIDDGQLD